MRRELLPEPRLPSSSRIFPLLPPSASWVELEAGKQTLKDPLPSSDWLATRHRHSAHLRQLPNPTSHWPKSTLELGF